MMVKKIKVIPYKLDYVKVRGHEGLQYVAKVKGLLIHSPDEEELKRGILMFGGVPKKETGLKMKRAKVEFR